jgi:hypothetical protein
MSYIYVINESDDPQTTIALYRKADDVMSISVHAWMTAYIPIGSKARFNIGSAYGIFISYTSSGGNIMYESAILPITDGEGSFRVTKSGSEINLIAVESPEIADEVIVEVDKKVGRLIYVNVIRNNQIYYTLPTSPGYSQEFIVQNDLFISKVRPEVMQGNILVAREILIPPSVIQAGETAVLTGDVNTGYDFTIRKEAYSDFIYLP